MTKYPGLQRKVDEYKRTLENTHVYRQAWQNGLRDTLVKTLEEMMQGTGLEGNLTISDNFGNAEAVILSLGKSASGIYARVDEDTNKPLIKDHGSLVYQQLFNGKIQVTVFLPYIEGFGKPPPPQMIAIYRPEELKTPYMERHMEEFIKQLREWEDYDDDNSTNQIGFQLANLNMPQKDE